MVRRYTLIRWGISYFVIILTFAFLYWVAFKVNPDGFIINEELNLTPIHDVYEYLWGDSKDVDNSTSIVGLDQLQSQLIARLVESTKIKESMDKLEMQREDLENKRSLALKKHKKLMGEKESEYENKKKHTILEQESKAVSELSDLEQRKMFLSNSSLISEYQTLIANKRVELAKLRVKKAEIDYEVSSYILSNLGSFADPETVKQIRSIDEHLSEMSDSLSERQSQLGKIRGAMHENLRNWYEERSKKLNFIDFTYYSIGISTTTTFGDITANSKIIRAMVCVQLVISVIVIGGFVNAVTKS